LLLYDGNGGRRQGALHGLTPIEYEFWRFLARVEACEPDCGLTPNMTLAIEREIQRSAPSDREAADSGGLRSRYIIEGLSGGGSLRDVVRARVRAVIIGDIERTRADIEFIRFLPEECVIRVRERRPWQAHLGVYRALADRLGRDLREGRVARVPAGLFDAHDEPHLIRITGLTKDEPGRLRATLFFCLENRLNIRMLLAREDDSSGDRRVYFEFRAAPSRRVRCESAECKLTLKRLRAFPLDDLTVDLVPAANMDSHADARPRIAVLTSKVRGDSLMLLVPFNDVPGALLEIVDIISATKIGGTYANITSIAPVFSAPHMAVSIQLDRPPGVPRDELTAELNYMEYRLHSAACVMGAAAHSDVVLKRIDA
jgi:hypothetical protein